MFVVKIDLWPYGSHREQENMLTIAVANDGGSERSDRGNYRAWVIDPEHAAADTAIYAEVGKRYDHADGYVWSFPRRNDQRHLAALTAAVIHALGLDEILVSSETHSETTAQMLAQAEDAA